MRKIGVDVDGVLADHVPHLLNYLNKNRCKELRLQRKDISQWNISICGRDFKSLFEEYLKYQDFILEMPVVEGAVEGIRKLSSHHIIFIVTNRPAYSAEATYRWLRKNNIEFHSLLVGREIDRIYMGIDILVDDNPYAVIEFASKKGLAILYSQPWNMTLPQVISNSIKSRNIIRCNTWDEIIDILGD